MLWMPPKRLQCHSAATRTQVETGTKNVKTCLHLELQESPCGATVFSFLSHATIVYHGWVFIFSGVVCPIWGMGARGCLLGNLFPVNRPVLAVWVYSMGIWLDNPFY